MIKVKTFFCNSQNYLHHEKLDDAINDFLSKNDVDIVDIKYSTSSFCNQRGGTGLYMSALLIFKPRE